MVPYQNGAILTFKTYVRYSKIP